MDDLERAKDLKRRLSLLRAKRKVSSSKGTSFVPSFSWGFRLGLEWVAHVLGGLGLGWVLDLFLTLRPWGLFFGLICGTLSGFINVYRALFSEK